MLLSNIKYHMNGPFTPLTLLPVSIFLMLLFFLFGLRAAFSSMIEGKNEEMSTTELSGGARIHYIFQNIFVKSLEVCFFHINFFFCWVEVSYYLLQCLLHSFLAWRIEIHL